MNNPPKIYSSFVCDDCHKTFSFDLGITYDDFPEAYVFMEFKTNGRFEHILTGYGLPSGQPDRPPIYKCVRCEDYAKYQRGIKAIKRWEETVADA